MTGFAGAPPGSTLIQGPFHRPPIIKRSIRTDLLTAPSANPAPKHLGRHPPHRLRSLEMYYHAHFPLPQTECRAERIVQFIQLPFVQGSSKIRQTSFCDTHKTVATESYRESIRICRLTTTKGRRRLRIITGRPADQVNISPGHSFWNSPASPPSAFRKAAFALIRSISRRSRSLSLSRSRYIQTADSIKSERFSIFDSDGYRLQQSL